MEARRKRSEELAAKTPLSQEQTAYFKESCFRSTSKTNKKSIQLRAKTHGFALDSMAGLSLLKAQLNLPALGSPAGRKPAQAYGAWRYLL